MRAIPYTIGTLLSVVAIAASPVTYSRTYNVEHRTQEEIVLDAEAQRKAYQRRAEEERLRKEAIHNHCKAFVQSYRQRTLLDDVRAGDLDIVRLQNSEETLEQTCQRVVAERPNVLPSMTLSAAKK